MNRKKLYIFAGADKWHYLLVHRNKRINDTSFTSDPEEHLRSFLRGSSVNRASIIISSESSILRFCKLPILKGPQLAKAISFLYSTHFPIEQEKYNFGYKILGKTSSKYQLLLAALPLTDIYDTLNLFGGMGIQIDKMLLFECVGGMQLSEFSSILVFVKQKMSWRVIWMKNRVPIDIWRVVESNDLRTLFAVMEFEDSIDHGLFYSTPEKWLIDFCEEQELTISEISDICSVFEECDTSFDLLPDSYKKSNLRHRIALISTIALITLACAAFAGSAWLQTQTYSMQEQRNEMTALIRSINDEADNPLFELPVGLMANRSELGETLRYITSRLPADTSISYIHASNDTIFLTVTSVGSDWVSQFTNQLDLALNIQTSRISQGEGITEIELRIELGG